MIARCLIAMLVCLGASLQASAEAPTSDELPAEQRAEYDELTKKGIREYDLGHWAEAKAYFARAHKLFPNARTQRALGLIAYETRSYVESLDLFEAALASQHKPLTDALRKEVTGLASDARTFVARITVTLDPETATATLDGKPVVLREGRVLLIDPGEYRLRVEAEGFVPEVRPLRANAGEVSELKIQLSRPGTEAVAASAQGADAAEVSSEFWSTQRVVGVSLGGGGVVALGVGVVSGLLALAAKQDSKRNCEGDFCNAEGTDSRETALTHADVASVSFIAGGALLAAGAITFFLAPGGEHPPEQALRVTPGPGLAGLAITGSL